MYLFVTDETNVQPSNSSKFFIYGGLIFSPEQAQAVHSDVEEIRRKYGFKPGDALKFDTRSRPEYVDRDQHREAKDQVIESCNKAGVKFIAYLVLHAIASGRATTGEWALSSVLVPFGEIFLRDQRDAGIVIIDRLPDGSGAYDMLKRKFQIGLEIDGSGTMRLNRILLYATTCDGASHLSSAVDIVLGAFRYVVNAQDRPQPGTAEGALLKKVAQMMYAKETGERLQAREYGLILRPKNVVHPPYKAEYDNLIGYLASLLSS